MKRHSERSDWQLAEVYELDTLGAPFKVTLRNSVHIKLHSESGEEMVRIPDMVGLVSEIVRLRAVDIRKLSGADVKFLRKALDVQAKKLAQFLGFSAEHYSRVEAGEKVMSPQAEKLFRLVAFISTFIEQPQQLFEGTVDFDSLPKPSKKAEEFQKKFVDLFISMKIKPARDVDVPIEYVLIRSSAPVEFDDIVDDEGDWLEVKPTHYSIAAA